MWSIRPAPHGMLAYHETDDRQTARRARRPPSSRSREAWFDLVRGDKGSHRVPSRSGSKADGRESRQERTSRYREEDRADLAAGGSSIAVLVDSGPLYAYVDEDDRDHEACLALLLEHPGPLIVPQLVVTEVAYLIESRLGSNAEVRFLGDLAAGNLTTDPVAAGDWLRIAELVADYRDLPLGTVDASVVAAAERLNIEAIATLDRKHFTVMRPGHVKAFMILP